MSGEGREQLGRGQYCRCTNYLRILYNVLYFSVVHLNFQCKLSILETFTELYKLSILEAFTELHKLVYWKHLLCYTS